MLDLEAASLPERPRNSDKDAAVAEWAVAVAATAVVVVIVGAVARDRSCHAEAHIVPAGRAAAGPARRARNGEVRMASLMNSSRNYKVNATESEVAVLASRVDECQLMCVGAQDSSAVIRNGSFPKAADAVGSVQAA